MIMLLMLQITLCYSICFISDGPIPESTVKNIAANNSICSQRERFRVMYESCTKPPSLEDIDTMPDREINTLAKGLYVADNLKTLACISYKAGWTTQRVVLANNSSPDPIPGDLGNKKIWNYLGPNK